jgi:methylglyoxal synthase
MIFGFIFWTATRVGCGEQTMSRAQKDNRRAAGSRNIKLCVVEGHANRSRPEPTQAGHEAAPLQNSRGRQTIALVAHDAKKTDLLSWSRVNLAKLQGMQIVATQSTGLLLKSELGLEPKLVNSGPLGGDQEIGALIARGELDMLIFFVDPLGVHPHASDVQSLIRIATLREIPAAYNLATADILGEKLAQARAVVA